MASRSKDGEASYANFLFLFNMLKTGDDPNAKRHGLHEMLVIALLTMLAGGRACIDMEDFGGLPASWLRRFLTLENGTPSRHLARLWQARTGTPHQQRRHLRHHSRQDDGSQVTAA